MAVKQREVSVSLWVDDADLSALQRVVRVD